MTTMVPFLFDTRPTVRNSGVANCNLTLQVELSTLLIPLFSEWGCDVRFYFATPLFRTVSVSMFRGRSLLSVLKHGHTNRAEERGREMKSDITIFIFLALTFQTMRSCIKHQVAQITVFHGYESVQGDPMSRFIAVENCYLSHLVLYTSAWSEKPKQEK